MNRRLTLKAERLTELTDADLLAVAAGHAITQKCERPTIDRCLTGYYPSINAPCTELLTPATTVGTS